MKCLSQISFILLFIHFFFINSITTGHTELYGINFLAEIPNQIDSRNQTPAILSTNTATIIIPSVKPVSKNQSLESPHNLRLPLWQVLFNDFNALRILIVKDILNTYSYVSDAGFKQDKMFLGMGIGYGGIEDYLVILLARSFAYTPDYFTVQLFLEFKGKLPLSTNFELTYYQGDAYARTTTERIDDIILYKSFGSMEIFILSIIENLWLTKKLALNIGIEGCYVKAKEKFSISSRNSNFNLNLNPTWKDFYGGTFRLGFRWEQDTSNPRWKISEELFFRTSQFYWEGKQIFNGILLTPQNEMNPSLFFNFKIKYAL